MKNMNDLAFTCAHILILIGAISLAYLTQMATGCRELAILVGFVAQILSIVTAHSWISDRIEFVIRKLKLGEKH